MGKEVRAKLGRVQEMRANADREEKKVRVLCSHQNKNDKIIVRMIRSNDPATGQQVMNGEVECPECGERFFITERNQAEVLDAASTLHDVIQQIRLYSKQSVDQENNILLGKLDIDLQEIPRLYKRVRETYNRGGNTGRGNKGRDKRNNQGSSVGHFGSPTTSFIGR